MSNAFWNYSKKFIALDRVGGANDAIRNYSKKNIALVVAIMKLRETFEEVGRDGGVLVDAITRTSANIN